MIPPLAQLTISAFSFIKSNSGADIRCLVSGVRGTWIVITSEFFNSVFKSTTSTPNSDAASGVMYGS